MITILSITMAIFCHLANAQQDVNEEKRSDTPIAEPSPAPEKTTAPANAAVSTPNPATIQAPEPATVPNQPKIQGDERRNYVAGSVRLFYDFGNKIFTNGTVTGGGTSGSFSGDYNVNTTGGLAVAGEFVSVINLRFRSAVELGYSLNFNRTINSIDVSGSGGSVHSDATGNLNESDVFLNGKFYLKRFYFLGGFNYPFLSAPGSIISLRSRLSYQVGVGINFTEGVGIDLQYKITEASATASPIIGGTQYFESFDNLTLYSLLLGLRYSFN